jgi:hypothetical protein
VGRIERVVSVLGVVIAGKMFVELFVREREKKIDVSLLWALIPCNHVKVQESRLFICVLPYQLVKVNSIFI